MILMSFTASNSLNFQIRQLWLVLTQPTQQGVYVVNSMNSRKQELRPAQQWIQLAKALYKVGSV